MAPFELFGPALVISCVALLVGAFALRAAHRRGRRRIADRDEARRMEQLRALARHEADGPTFDPAPGSITGRTATIRIHMAGGPGSVLVEVIPEALWCSGLSVGSGTWPIGDSVCVPSVIPGEQFMLTAHLIIESKFQHYEDKVTLPLLLIVESREEKPRTWERRVAVTLL